MKKHIALLSALLMIMALFAGCGGSKSAAAADSYAVEAPAAMPAQEEYSYDIAEEEGYNDAIDMGGAASGTAVVSERKLIRNVYLNLETREFDKAVEEINALVARLGGYIEYSDISGQSLSYQGDYYRRYANFTARIPAEKLDEATQSLDALCNVTSRSESVNDITDSYYDVDGRLKTLRIEEERLLALLEKAEKLEDMLTIESHLSEVRYQIESLTGQLNRMDSQVSYSTVEMYLQEVVEYSDKKIEPVSFGQRVGEAFQNSLLFIRNFGQGAVLVVVSVLPFVLVYGGALLIVALIVVKIVRSIRKKKNGPKPPMPPADHEKTA